MIRTNLELKLLHLDRKQRSSDMLGPWILYWDALMMFVILVLGQFYLGFMSDEFKKALVTDKKN